MPPLRAQLIQAHLANLQVKVARRAAAQKRRAALELDPGEIELFRQRTAAENRRLSPRSPA
jgi:hypothetical protein